MEGGGGGGNVGFYIDTEHDEVYERWQNMVGFGVDALLEKAKKKKR